MKIPTRQRGRGLRFNIMPLIDIIFLLIIFFLAASHFVRNEAQEPVDLPKATPEEDPAEPPRRIVITITSDQQILVGNRTVNQTDLEQMILTSRGDEEAKRGSLEVRIRGDRRVPYAVIEPILLACARAGVTNVKFAVLPK